MNILNSNFARFCNPILFSLLINKSFSSEMYPRSSLIVPSLSKNIAPKEIFSFGTLFVVENLVKRWDVILVFVLLKLRTLLVKWTTLQIKNIYLVE